MRKKLIIAFISFTIQVQAQFTSKEEVAPEFVADREAQKKEIVQNYLALKNSFILSESLAIEANAIALQNALKKFKFKKLNLGQMNKATVTRKEIIALTTEIKASKNINEQRSAFQILSEKFWSIADKFKATDVKLHLQFCPMSNVVWVSDSEQIQNPYYPKNMLTCGEVKASL